MVEKGHVSSIHASLPWANHWSGVSIKIQGLELNLVPVKHKEQQHHRKPGRYIKEIRGVLINYRYFNRGVYHVLFFAFRR